MRVNSLLLVEDDEVAVEVFRACMERSGFSFSFHHADNGKTALEFLRSATRSLLIDAPHFMIVLDINMPVLDGFDFLRERQKDPWLRQMPVFVNSSSTDPKTVSTAYELGATAYFVKPSTLSHGTNVVSMVSQFMTYCTLPPPHNATNQGFHGAA